MTARTRDPLIDLLRAAAVCGVVIGHWMVTPLTPGQDGLIASSPLATQPQLTPLSWVFQTLGLLFFVSGHAASAGRHQPSAGADWWRRVRRFAPPVAALCGAWAVVLAVLAVRGLPQQTVATVAQLVVTPLWFLGVLLLLLAGTPLMRRLDDRFGAAAALLPAALALSGEAVAAISDSGLAQAVGLTTAVTVWWVPWQLGTASAAGRRPGRLAGAALIMVGVLGMIAAVTAFGYPAPAVGVPGAERSNLAPPSPVVLALAVAQIGLVLVLWPRLRRIAAHPITGRVVALVDRHALGVLLLHQSALIVVSLVAARAGVVPGLHTDSGGPGWPLLRLVWLPVFALVLLILLRVAALAAPTTRAGRDDASVRRRPRRARESTRDRAETEPDRGPENTKRTATLE
ncbi:peptidoglycan/LPS O-acetylase OafA/YrhL [Actinoalloteichus hoggarensis]|uniref:Acyltransferase family protein n=1 Tax=Actinoalloteichus hoggarensis TaxID=1470176 RepID=A0A221W6A6_9PSEU|nr:acyltransferase [Actinoalloteichus hoggarensis]ASO21418.1 Acyltransferase family protein [Actinoalloteichus hoggarensis]MBB5921351.1 peptidoglycan/LPS O-acetylase OafA/YrhL [Actinoalloteichus hoggarensis]